MRMPLVLSITCLIGRRRAAAMISRISDGWWARRPRSAPGRARLRSPPGRRTCARPRPGCGGCSRLGEESAKQTGQARLQASLISTMARQECCSWSGQRPQSHGQPRSVRVCGAKRPVAGLQVFQRAAPVDRIVATPASSSRRARRSAWSSRCRRPPRRSWPAPGRGRSRTTRWSGRGRDRARTYALCRRTSRPPLRIMTAAYRTRPRQTNGRG